MANNSWRIGRIAGIEIRIDPSWTLIALLIAYSLFLQFTFSYPRLSDGAGIVLAIAASILFFGSVLAHELTHSLVARSRGIPVRDITLFIFGGATHAQVDSHGPRDEFVVTVVGPLSSLVLAGVFWAASTLAGGMFPRPVGGALGYLGWVNLILAGFNLLPGFPLDGGRLLRAAVWSATGSQRTGTRVATLAGEIIGYTLLAFGALLVFAGGLIGGIWFAAIGWFLAQSARGSFREFEVREATRGVDVDDVMERGLTTIPDDVSLRAAADRYVARSDQEIFPVEADGGGRGRAHERAARDGRPQ
jgi:Zn-dependent protease